MSTVRTPIDVLRPIRRIPCHMYSLVAWYKNIRAGVQLPLTLSTNSKPSEILLYFLDRLDIGEFPIEVPKMRLVLFR